MAWWNMIRMPGRSHQGPLPPLDDERVRLATELRIHVKQVAEEIGERNVLHRPHELNQTADYIEAEFARAGYEVAGNDLNPKAVANLGIEAERTSAFEVNGGYNLLEGNLSVGTPIGVRVRGDGDGNFVSWNRLEQATTAVLDETGRAAVVPPAGVQDYRATVPQKTK